jgi:hypothetical protein
MHVKLKSQLIVMSLEGPIYTGTHLNVLHNLFVRAPIWAVPCCAALQRLYFRGHHDISLAVQHTTKTQSSIKTKYAIHTDLLYAPTSTLI